MTYDILAEDLIRWGRHEGIIFWVGLAWWDFLGGLGVMGRDLIKALFGYRIGKK
jgi:hypothetical protein